MHPALNSELKHLLLWIFFSCLQQQPSIDPSKADCIIEKKFSGQVVPFAICSSEIGERSQSAKILSRNYCFLIGIFIEFQKQIVREISEIMRQRRVTIQIKMRTTHQYLGIESDTDDVSCTSESRWSVVNAYIADLCSDCRGSLVSERNQTDFSSNQGGKKSKLLFMFLQ